MYFYKLNSRKNLFFVLELNTSTFLQNVTKSKLQNNYLFSKNGNLIFKPNVLPHEVSEKTVIDLIAKLQLSVSNTSQVRELTLDGQSYLLASVPSKNGLEVLVSITPKSIALEALKILGVKTGLLVIFILGLAIVISVLGASRLTKNISKLYKAVNKVIEGDLSINVDIESRDEIGVLAKGFNHMVQRVRELLKETAEKARMEGELKTAQTVQSRLFPNGELKTKNLVVSGFYEPASECGGDWYSYSVVGDKAYFWIGDATGHGVSAALITSAAKSAATIIQKMQNQSTADIMSLLNESILATSGGEVMMTFFVGCLDLKSGHFTYTNASHDTPYLLPKQDAPYKRNNILPILGQQGVRLGEASMSQYEIGELQLAHGDRILFYTDGVPEILNATGEQLGEGKFLRQIVTSFNKENELNLIVKDLIQEAYNFKGSEPLHDDVTLFAFEYRDPDVSH